MTKTLEHHRPERLVDLPFLHESERRVIAARLGHDGHGRSIAEVALLLHLSRDVVARTEAVVACKLAHPSASGSAEAARLRRRMQHLPR